jgi:hypothetical protein
MSNIDVCIPELSFLLGDSDWKWIKLAQCEDKFVLVHVIKACAVSEGSNQLFLNIACIGQLRTPVAFSPGKEPPVFIEQDNDWAPEPE